MSKTVNKENKVFAAIVIGVIFYIYGWIGRTQLFEHSYLTNEVVNQWDPIFDFITNIYVQNYVITPVMLYLSMKIIQGNASPYQMIRRETIKNWVFDISKKFLREVGNILFLQLVVSILLTIGTPLEMGWSNFAKNTGLTDIASSHFSSLIDIPIVALLIHVSVFVLGYLALHLTITFFYLVVKKRSPLLIFSVFLWLYTVASLVLFQGHFSTITTMNFLNWFVGSQSFTQPYYSLILGLVYIILCIGIIKIWDYNLYALKRKFSGFRRIFPKKSHFIYFVLVISTIFYGISQGKATSINEAIIISGIGSSTTTFHFMYYLAYLIIFYGIVYLNLLYIDQLIQTTSYYRLIRNRSTNRYSFDIAKKICKQTMIFLFLFLGIILIIAKIFFSLPMVMYTDPLVISEVLYHFFINHFLQIILYLLLAIILYFFAGEMFQSLAVLVALSFTMFPPFNNFIFIPIGLNSFSYLLDGHSTYLITEILLLYITIELIIIYYFLNYKDLKL